MKKVKFVEPGKLCRRLQSSQEFKSSAISVKEHEAADIMITENGMPTSKVAQKTLILCPPNLIGVVQRNISQRSKGDKHLLNAMSYDEALRHFEALVEATTEGRQEAIAA